MQKKNARGPVCFAVGVTVGSSISEGIFGGGLLVRLEVEVDEQEEIAGQKEASEECRRFRASTVADIGEGSGIVLEGHTFIG